MKKKLVDGHEKEDSLDILSVIENCFGDDIDVDCVCLVF